MKHKQLDLLVVILWGFSIAKLKASGAITTSPNFRSGHVAITNTSR